VPVLHAFPDIDADIDEIGKLLVGLEERALLRPDLRHLGAFMLMLDRLPQPVDGIGYFQFRDILSRVMPRLLARRAAEGGGESGHESTADDVASLNHAVLQII